ncbi:hypothetical protein OAO18_00620 [Francisellaceae bacterium]|nr:hypothetical protein [Francisellaceae bacterium]
MFLSKTKAKAITMLFASASMLFTTIPVFSETVSEDQTKDSMDDKLQLDIGSSALLSAQQSSGSSGQVSNDIISTAFGTMSGTVEVDPHTGTLSLSYPMGSMWANGLQGQQYSLVAEYNGSRTNPAYELGRGWNFALPYIDRNKSLAYFPGGLKFYLEDGIKLKYAKGEDKQFSFKRGTGFDDFFIFTDNADTKYYFNGDGLLVKQIDALGYAIHFIYNGSGNRLSEIKDDSGRNILIDTRFDLSETTVSSLSYNGERTETSFQASGNSVTFTNPLDQQMNISSDSLSWPGLPTKVTLPSGLIYEVEYTPLKGISGQQSAYAVSKLVVNPNTVLPKWAVDDKSIYEPQMTTNYQYTSNENTNNYLGANSPIQAQVFGTDPFLLNTFLASYRYNTSQEQLDEYRNVAIKSTQQYDRFHRIIEENVYFETSNNLLGKKTYSYENDKNSSYEELGVAYKNPSKVITTGYGVNSSTGKAATSLVNIKSYNENGNVISEQEGYLDSEDKIVINSTTNKAYFSAEEAGPFEHLIKTETTTPSELPNLITPPPVTTKHQLAYLDRQVGENSYHSAYPNKDTIVINGNEKREQQSGLVAEQTSPFYGLVNQQKITLPNKTPATSTSNNYSGQVTKYDYTVDVNSDLDFPDIIEEVDLAASSDQSTAVNISKQAVSGYNGQLKWTEDKLGNIQTYEYDALGRVVNVTGLSQSNHPLVTHYDYDLNSYNGLMTITQTDPEGNIVKIYLDSLGRQVATESSDINQSAQLIPISGTYYNEFNQVEQSLLYIDKDKPSYTNFEYDALGDPITQINADGSADIQIHDRGYGRDISYHLVSNDLATDNKNSLCHLADGRSSGCIAYAFTVKQTSTANHKMDNYTFLVKPDATFETGLLVYTSTDLKNKLTKLTGNLLQGKIIDSEELAAFVNEAINQNAFYKHESAQYNNAGQMVSTVDSHGFVTKYEYDEQNKLVNKHVSTTDSTIHYGYDDLSGEISSVSVTNNKTNHTYTLATREYNSLGQLVSTTNASGFKVTNEYDNNGLLISTTNANGKVTHYSYDNLGRLISTQFDEDKTQYTYANENMPNQVTSVSNNNSLYQFDYYPDGTLKSQNVSYLMSNQPVATTNWKYNGYNVLQSIDDSLSETSTLYQYDNLGRITTITDNPGEHKIQNVYQATGQLIQQTNDKLIKNFEYGQTRTGLPLLNSISITDQQENNIYKFEYDYDDDARITTIIRPYTQYHYGYDPKSGQLTSYTCQDLGFSGSYCPKDEQGNYVLSQHFSYDRVMNNLLDIQEQLKSNTGENLTNTVHYGYDNTNNPAQLTSYGNENTNYLQTVNLMYDNQGNMITDQGGNQLVYDGRDQLMQVIPSNQNATQGIISYGYDASGRQISNKESGGEPIYVYYASDKPVNEIQNGKVNHYNNAGQIINGHWQYYLQDLSNNVISVMDESGNMNGFHTYLPFGFSSNQSKDEENITQNKLLNIEQLSKGYNGELTDRKTGYQFLGNGYRAYNPLLARFMKYDSASPLGVGGLNGYVYANNNPIMYTDPTGHILNWLGAIIDFAIGVVTIAAGIATASPVLLMAGANNLVNSAFGFIDTAINGAQDDGKSWGVYFMDQGLNLAASAVGMGVDKTIFRLGAKAGLSALPTGLLAGAASSPVYDTGSMASDAIQGKAFNTSGYLVNIGVSSLTAGIAEGFTSKVTDKLINNTKLKKLSGAEDNLSSNQLLDNFSENRKVLNGFKEAISIRFEANSLNKNLIKDPRAMNDVNSLFKNDFETKTVAETFNIKSDSYTKERLAATYATRLNYFIFKSVVRDGSDFVVEQTSGKGWKDRLKESVSGSKSTQATQSWQSDMPTSIYQRTNDYMADATG